MTGEKFFASVCERLQLMSDSELVLAYSEAIKHDDDESAGFWTFRKTAALLVAHERGLKLHSV